MTYTLSATKKQGGRATVQATFSYEENILFPHHKPGRDKEWEKAAEEIVKRKQARQSNVRDTIKSFLESKYGAKGLKNYGPIAHMDFVLTDHYAKQTRSYHANANGTTYNVEVSGDLARGEHLEDMLDCEALDCELNKVFAETGTR